MSSFLKYTGLSILIQLLACIVVWVLTLTLAPMFNPIFGAMISFYHPAILLVSRLASSGGESALTASVFFGVIIGIISYGVIFGFAAALFKKNK